ncbi:ATP-binding protein [Niveibacterium terrae]|uniref:ATP-binding protein n=1 Tax=Niveibacterium terrae TaxID=3373598 RepID=UPI003A8E0B5B
MTRSLRLTILFFVAIGLVLPAALSLAVIYSGADRETKRQIGAQLDQYTDILAFGARDPLWNMDPESLRPLAEALTNNPDVVLITIRDQAAGPLLSLDHRKPNVAVRYATRKVMFRDRELGSVVVGITGESLIARNRQQIGAQTTTMLIQLTLATVLIFMLLRRQLIEPLETLGEAADALAHGKLEHPIPALGRNEIGRLGQRLESTRRKLLRLFASLEDKNTALAHELGERERSDRARRESEDLLRTVFALAAEPLIVRRRRDNLQLLSNPAWLAAFGRTDADESAPLWVDPAQRQSCYESLDREGGFAQREVRLRHRNGSEVLMLASASCFENLGEACVLWSLHDITAARAAEDALRENEQQFVALFRYAPVPLCIIDIEDEARIVDVNSPFEAEFGLPRADCRGRALASLGLWAQEADGERFMGLLEEHSHDKIEAWMRTEQGPTCRDIAGRHMTLRDRHCFVWSAIDVTPIIRAKQEVDEVNRNLEAKVALRTQALERSKQELEASIEKLGLTQAQLVQSEKLAALGSLVAGIAHELNTPIGNCVMVASTLEDERVKLTREIETGLSRSALTAYFELLREGNESLTRNLGRAADLVTSFKQVAVDQTSSQRRIFDLREIIREIEITLAPTLRKSNARFLNAVEDGIIMDGYPGPLGQVITNLTSNAVTHGFEGRSEGGCITISAEPSPDGQVRLCVEDDGCGIPEANLARIFDPFFTTRLGKGGSGLGLHIVYNIITGVLGGQIAVDSHPGKGSRFYLNLPRKAPQGGGITP